MAARAGAPAGAVSRRRLEELLAEARAALGAYVGADPDDLVFVPNASAGVNVAAWPLGLEQGDRRVVPAYVYDVGQAKRWVPNPAPGAKSKVR